MRPLRVREFDQRFKALRKQLLPSHFSRTGNYTIEQYTLAMAFRTAFHAELETFFEDLALWALSELDRKVRAGENCRAAAAILCLFKSEIMGGMPAQIAEIGPRPFLRKAQLACIHELKRKIEANRGIKTHNVLMMYLPLGLEETQLDEQFLIDLNTLGARRGDVAHKGLRAVTALPDPRDDKNLAERIVASLEAFVNLVEPAVV